MNTSNKGKKKGRNSKDLASTQAKRIEELEKRVFKLEKKKPSFKKTVNNIKRFLFKHKFLFIIALSLLILIMSWEGYSLYAYKAASNLARSAQEENDFEKAGEELLKMQKITNRSLALFFLRKDSVENRISYNEEWERSYDNALISTTKPAEKEKEEELSNTNQEPDTQTTIQQTLPKPIPSESEPKPTSTESEPEPALSETYNYHEYYPIILSLTDNKGNVIKRSEFNEYSGFDKYRSNTTNTTLKIGDQINLSVEASDPEGRQLFYNFTSNSTWFNQQHGISEGSYKWTTSKNISHIITLEDLQSAGESMRIVARIKTEKTNLRFPGGELDDEIFLDYTLSPN